jgi:predicted nucleotidyltransferase
MERPDVDSIDGLSPAISIQQKTTYWSAPEVMGSIPVPGGADHRSPWSAYCRQSLCPADAGDRIRSPAPPLKMAILFGSAATGQMTKDSDIDLLIVEPAPANARERSAEIRDAVGDIGYPVDVIVMRTDRFEGTKRFIGGIAYPANKYGRVIYAAA